MKNIYYIIFFIGIAVLTVAGVVWYLRRDSGTPIYQSFGGSSSVEQTENYDEPSKFMPASGYTELTEIEPTPTELVPTALPPGLSQ